MENPINIDMYLDIDISEYIYTFIYSDMSISRYISIFIRVFPGVGDGGTPLHYLKIYQKLPPLQE